MVYGIMKIMDPQLKKMNKLLLKSKPKTKNFGKIFKTAIIIFLSIAIPLSLILFTPILEKREIIISGPGERGKTIINLGHLGLALPSFLKNKERVNLLFLGIPGQGYRAPNLTDTIIIINSTPKAENPIAISIPRDLLVKSPNYYTKINSIYQEGGIKAIKSSLKEITNLDIDYFIVLDLEGVKKLVDQFGGIDVFVEKDIYDPQFPGPNDSYITFSLNKGHHHLDGETALKYIRTRHEPGGDFARIKRQQQVINILKDKILSLNLFWNFPTILKIWKTLNEHTYTNIGLTDIKYAWNLAKKTNLDEIEFITLNNQPEGNQLLVSDKIILGDEEAYILKPRAGLNNYEEIKNYINQLINSPWF